MRHKTKVEKAWISRCKLFANVRLNSQIIVHAAIISINTDDYCFRMLRMTIDSGPLESHLC